MAEPLDINLDLFDINVYIYVYTSHINIMIVRKHDCTYIFYNS